MLVIKRSIEKEEALFLVKEIESFLLGNRTAFNKTSGNINTFIFKLKQSLDQNLSNLDLLGIYLEVARKLSTNDLGGMFIKLNAYSNFLNQQKERVDLLGVNIYNQILSEKEEINQIKNRIKRNLIALRSYRNESKDFILNLREINLFHSQTKEPSLFISSSVNGTTLPVVNSSLVGVERITVLNGSNGKLGDPDNINSSTNYSDLNNLLLDDELSILTYSRTQDNSVELGLNFLLKKESLVNAFEISALNAIGSDSVEVTNVQFRKEGFPWQNLEEKSFQIEDDFLYLFNPIRATELRIFFKNKGSSAIEIRPGVFVQRSLLPLRLVRPRLVSFGPKGTCVSKKFDTVAFKGFSEPLLTGTGLNLNLFKFTVFIGEENNWQRLSSLQEDQDNIAFINKEFEIKLDIERKKFSEISSLSNEIRSIVGSNFVAINKIQIVNNQLKVPGLTPESLFIKDTSFKVGEEFQLPRYNLSDVSGQLKIHFPNYLNIKNLTFNGNQASFEHRGDYVYVDDVPVNSRIDIETEYEYPLVELSNNNFYLISRFPLLPSKTTWYLGNYRSATNEQFFPPRESRIYLNHKFIKLDSIKVYSGSSLLQVTDWVFNSTDLSLEITNQNIDPDSLRRATYEYVPQINKDPKPLIRKGRLSFKADERQLAVKSVEESLEGERVNLVQWNEGGGLRLFPNQSLVKINARSFALSNQQVIKNTVTLKGFSESLQELEYIDGQSEFRRNSRINSNLDQVQVAGNVGTITSELFAGIILETVTSNKSRLFNNQVNNLASISQEGDWALEQNTIGFYVPSGYSLSDAILTFSIEFQSPNLLLYSIDYVNGLVFFSKDIDEKNKICEYMCAKVMVQGSVFKNIDHQKEENKVLFQESVLENIYHVYNSSDTTENLQELEQFYSPRLNELILQSVKI